MTVAAQARPAGVRKNPLRAEAHLPLKQGEDRFKKSTDDKMISSCTHTQLILPLRREGGRRPDEVGGVEQTAELNAGAKVRR
jgi:hypothetical protein